MRKQNGKRVKNLIWHVRGEGKAWGGISPEDEPAEALCRQMRQMVPETEKKESAMREIRQSIARKRLRYTPSRHELVWIELQYISPLFWMLQGILVAALPVLLERISVSQGELKDYLQWISVLAAWMGVVTCSDLARHFSRGMAELEQSCYFNLPQLWTLRMILSGMADILILTLCSLRISENTFVPFVRVCLYILVPFVMSNACCLFLVTWLRSVRGGYGQLVMAFLVGSITAAFVMIPSDIYENTFLWMWILLFLTGIMLYFWQIRRMYGKIRRGEALCWN